MKSSTHPRLTLWLTLILCMLIFGFRLLGCTAGLLPFWTAVDCAIGGSRHSGFACNIVFEHICVHVRYV